MIISELELHTCDYARARTHTHTYRNISPVLTHSRCHYSSLSLSLSPSLCSTHTHADQVSLDAISANDKDSLAKCHNTPTGAAVHAVRSSTMSDPVAISLSCTVVGSRWTDIDVISH